MNHASRGDTSDFFNSLLTVEHFWDNRHDKVQIFELEVSDAPKIRIDNREIIEARFFTLAEAQLLRLPKPLYDYFQMMVPA